MTCTVFSGFICFTLLASTLGYIPILNKFSIRPSQIPQFILDIRHPWIDRNKETLEKLNAKDALCNANSPLRSALDPVPEDLFKNLRIENGRASGPDAIVWQYVGLRLEEILECQLALESCEYLRVDIHELHSRHLSDPPVEHILPPKSLPGLFVDTLKNMPKLQTLTWIQPLRNAAVAKALESGFSERRLVLPGVRRLSVHPNTHFLLTLTPNVEFIGLRGGSRWNPLHPEERNLWEAFRTSVKDMKSLTALTLEAEWTAKLLETVWEVLPHLQTLRMQGRVHAWYQQRFSTTEPNLELKALSRILAKFPNLTILEIPENTGLGLGFDGGPWCGNAFFGLDGKRYGRSITRESIWADETAAKLILSEAPFLKYLAVGEGSDKLVVEGKVNWPWSGGIRQYLLDQWPRCNAKLDPECGTEDEDPNGPLFWSWEDDKQILSQDWEPYYASDYLDDEEVIDSPFMNFEQDEEDRVLRQLQEEMEM